MTTISSGGRISCAGPVTQPTGPSGSVKVGNDTYTVTNGQVSHNGRTIGTITDGGDFNVTIDGQAVQGNVSQLHGAAVQGTLSNGTRVNNTPTGTVIAGSDTFDVRGGEVYQQGVKLGTIDDSGRYNVHLNGQQVTGSIGENPDIQYAATKGDGTFVTNMANPPGVSGGGSGGCSGVPGGGNNGGGGNGVVTGGNGGGGNGVVTGGNGGGGNGVVTGGGNGGGGNGVVTGGGNGVVTGGGNGVVTGGGNGVVTGGGNGVVTGGGNDVVTGGGNVVTGGGNVVTGGGNGVTGGGNVVTGGNPIVSPTSTSAQGADLKQLEDQLAKVLEEMFMKILEERLMHALSGLLGNALDEQGLGGGFDGALFGQQSQQPGFNGFNFPQSLGSQPTSQGFALSGAEQPSVGQTNRQTNRQTQNLVPGKPAELDKFKRMLMKDAGLTYKQAGKVLEFFGLKEPMTTRSMFGASIHA